jgi:RNA polymerase sigma-70 factor, ECF subfamily
MSELDELETKLEAARQAFLGRVGSLRPELHRYCARMVGSAIDGEDLVQETLATAYYKLSLMKQDVPLQAWLFKIAHNKCIDFLRARRPHEEWIEDAFDGVAPVDDELERRQLLDDAFRHILGALAPAERACVVMKDVLGYELTEIAHILDTTVGGVKAALHRGRQKLRETTRQHAVPRQGSLEHQEHLARFVERFNARDWDGLAALLRADAQCDVVGTWAAVGRDVIRRNYFQKYAGFEFSWRIGQAEVDGERVAVCWHEVEGSWRARSFIRLQWDGEHIRSLRDYIYIPYLLEDARITPLDT